MERLNELDTELFCWINRHYCGLLDWVLWVASQAWSWAIVLISVWWYLSFYRTKKFSASEANKGGTFLKGNLWWIILGGIALCFMLSDRTSVMCFKDVFQRLRPCHALENVRMFHTTCGGKYGFVSSHAANVFSLAIFITLICKRFFEKWKEIGIVLFVWAFIVGYSRPYLGKHYPGDVICGALVGLIIGWGVYWIMLRIADRVSSKLGR